jgi:hypothetical protein
MEIENLQQLFQISKERLEGQTGTINITFANRNHVYTGNDVIGNCLQEWLPEWFKYLGVHIYPGGGTQAFPDFTAEFNKISYDIEVKAWNITAAPAFDLANFQSFIESTYKSPAKINANYFILGYMPAHDGFAQGFTVKKVFLKKIWEITGKSQKYPISIQVKRGNPYALRPINFYKNPSKSFGNKEAFLKAIKETSYMFPNSELPCTSDQWYTRVTHLLNR